MTLHLITDYINKKNIPLGNTVEETINNVLETFAKDPENKFHGQVKYELISPASVVLMGLGNINDPIKLYTNLANAFSKRGICLFPRTVKSAFIRLQNDAIEQGKLKEIEWLISSYSNPLIRGALSHRLSKYFLDYHFKLNNQEVKEGAAYALVRNSETSVEEIEELLKNENTLIAEAASKGLITAQCNRLTKKDYEFFLKTANNSARKNILQAMFIRKKLISKNELLEYLKSNDYQTRSAIIDALKYRHDIPLKEIQEFIRINNIKIQDYMLPRFYVRERMEPAINTHRTPIRFVSGKRPARVKKLQELLKPFRK